jgi:hypothetical protein
MKAYCACRLRGCDCKEDQLEQIYMTIESKKKRPNLVSRMKLLYIHGDILQDRFPDSQQSHLITFKNALAVINTAITALAHRKCFFLYLILESGSGGCGCGRSAENELFSPGDCSFDNRIFRCLVISPERCSWSHHGYKQSL